MTASGPDKGSVATAARPNRILVVDDEDIVRVLLKEILVEQGYDVTEAADGNQALELLGKKGFDLIITDMVMPGMNGVELLQAAFRIDPTYQVIMITGYPSVENAVRLVNLGAADYIVKPFNVDLIKITVAKTLELKKVKSAAPRAESSGQSAAVDGVTGAYNFVLFDQLLAGEIGRSKLRGHSCSLMLAEIDKLDSFAAKGGPDASDQVLKTFVGMLRKAIRPGDLIARMDRAELALMLPETARDEAEALGLKVCKGAEWSFTVSAGLATFPRDASDAESLVKKARSALQAAKSRGGNQLLLPR
jgi:diguanylate cyclase (GGDEF)-like protein